MKAVYEYENGEIGETVGLQGFGREIVERVLESHDVVNVWLLQDDEDDDDIDYGAPDWTLKTWWVTRADGAVAKVNLGEYSPDEEDLWDAIGKQYPEAWELIPEDGIESSRVCQCGRWDLQVWPGQGEELAAWLRNAVVRLVDEHERVVWEREGRPDELVEKAEDEAMRIAASYAGDLWELELFVRIGSETVWSYHEDVEEALRAENPEEASE